MFRPPISSDVQVFSGGFIAVGRGASAIGATVDDGWLTTPFVGDDCADSVISDPFVSGAGGGLTRLGLVIGMADLVTVRDAIALALAR